MTTNPRVAIVGAGPGGSMLGRLLSLSGVSFVIYESEKSPQFRRQGSTLDMHADTGLAAVKKAGLWEEFEKNARYDGEAATMADKNFMIHLKHEAEGKGWEWSRPEVDRMALRRMLLKSLPEGAVKWGHHVKTVGEDGTISFNEQETAGPFELIVGADGAWSKVRSLVTTDWPFYVGISGFGISITEPEKNCPELQEQLREGSLFCFCEGKSLSAQQLGDGTLSANVWFKIPEGSLEELPFDVHNDMEATREFLLTKIYHDWHPRLAGYIKACNDDFEPRTMYMLPVGNTWSHRKGFTLLGDAAHLMAPFAGEGVNTALADSMHLGQAIVDGIAAGDMDAGVAKAEEEMFARVKYLQKVTKDQLDGFFNEAPDSLYRTVCYMLDRFKPNMRPEIHAKLVSHNEHPFQGP